VFVRDLRTNATSLASRRNGRRGASIRASRFGAPSISGDGRFVAFEAGGNIFVRDRRRDTTTLASRASGPAGVRGNRESRFPSISADGRRVAFESDASNLTPNDHSPYTDVFVRDLVTHTTIPVSPSASITANGFSGSPVIAADGSSVAFRSTRGGIPRVTAVYVRNLLTQVTVLVSRASGADGALASYGRDIRYAISGDGQRVALGARSNNLTVDDMDLLRDVFIRDLGAQTTTLVSRASGPDGAKGNANSGDVSISADGLLLLFTSNATNLTPGDQHGGVFLRELAPPS
jgi:Tol biopolymer transport system component